MSKIAKTAVVVTDVPPDPRAEVLAALIATGVAAADAVKALAAAAEGDRSAAEAALADAQAKAQQAEAAVLSLWDAAAGTAWQETDARLNALEEKVMAHGRRFEAAAFAAPASSNPETAPEQPMVAALALVNIRTNGRFYRQGQHVDLAVADFERLRRRGDVIATTE